MAVTQVPLAWAEPAGLTGSGEAYEVFDGSMLADKKTYKSVRIVVSCIIRYATKRLGNPLNVSWYARHCSKCMVKDTFENKAPCFHQKAAIEKHIELKGEEDWQFAREAQARIIGETK